MRKLLALVLFLSVILPFVSPHSAMAASSFSPDTGGTLTTSLRAWYNLEANSNDSFSTLHGTDVNSPTFSSSHGIISNGEGLVKASSQRSDLPNGVIPWGTQNWSISFWFRRNATANTDYAIIGSQTTGAGTGGLLIAYGPSLIAAGKLGVQEIGTGGLGASANWTQDTNWHHVVVVHRSSGTTLEMYLDGSSFATNAGTPINLLDSSNPVALGARQIGTPDFYYDGDLDLVGFWGKSLSSTEIADLYNSGSGNFYGEQAGGAIAPLMQVVWWDGTD